MSKGIFADVIISNVGNGLGNTAKLQHPGNRSALTFVVYDDRFNLVQPIGIGKADPPGHSIELKPGEKFSHSVEPYKSERGDFIFEFMTGTAWFGYLLEKGKTYRVVAIYRGVGANQ